MEHSIARWWRWHAGANSPPPYWRRWLHPVRFLISAVEAGVTHVDRCAGHARDQAMHVASSHRGECSSLLTVADVTLFGAISDLWAGSSLEPRLRPVASGPGAMVSPGVAMSQLSVAMKPGGGGGPVRVRRIGSRVQPPLHPLRPVEHPTRPMCSLTKRRNSAAVPLERRTRRAKLYVVTSRAPQPSG